MKKILITGSAGLIGSEAVTFFANKGYQVHGIDNNQRGQFFGSDGSVAKNNSALKKQFDQYIHYNIDIRNKKKIEEVLRKNDFELIIHTAAQPSHDWSGKYPFIDFEINAYGTVILLDAYRKYNPDAVFIFTSSSKVYGDTPNTLKYTERKTRYDLPKSHKYYRGINELMSLDNSLHSPYGAGKAGADLMVQEFGKYYGLKTVVFRPNCMTGPAHAGAKLHGFLSYLVKCIVQRKKYIVNGYHGKQVRDNIHSFDLVNAFYHAFKKPTSGETYNIGGGRENSISILEVIKMIEEITQIKARFEIHPVSRRGDHIWYISDNSKFKKQYPQWKMTHSLKDTLKEMYHASIKQL